MTMLDTIRDMQTRSIEGVRSAQEQIISQNERLAATMLSLSPGWQSPFARYIPSPTDMVEAYFGYLAELHEVNREFATRITAAWDTTEDQ